MQDNSMPSKQFLEMSTSERYEYVLSMPSTNQELLFKETDFKFPEENFVNFYGQAKPNRLKLATYRAEPRAKSPIGLVILIHAYQIHSGNLAPLAKRLASEGYVALAFDWRGQGKSEGTRGQIESYKDCIGDICNFIRLALKMYPDLPLFIFGEGLGATFVLYVSLYYFQQFKISGLILSGGVYQLAPENPLYKLVYKVAIGIIKIVPAKIDLFKMNFNQTVRNKKACEYLINDPLNFHGKIDTHSLSQMVDLLSDLPSELWGKMQTPPIAIIHGEANKLVLSYSSYSFFNEIKTKDKELWYYKEMGFFMTLHKQYKQIEERTVNWLNKHSMKTPK